MPKAKKVKKAAKPTIKEADIAEVLDEHGEGYKCKMKDGTIQIVPRDTFKKEPVI